MGNKKSKQLKPVPPITIGPFSPRVAKILLEATGCERFAEYLYKTINDFLREETEGRVQATKVEVYEHERNSASYEE